MLRAEAATQRAAARTTRDTWLDHVIIAFALALLLSGFRSTVSGTDWWVTTVLVATLTGLTCVVLRAVGLRWVAPIALVVELVAVAWIFVPETLIVFIPTPATFRELGSLASSAQDIIVGEQAPVAAAKPIVLLMASSFGLLVIVADTLLVRRQAAAAIGVLLLSVFATPALISGETPSVWLFVAVAALWLVILRSRTALAGTFGRRQRGPAMVLATAALAAAVAFPIISPDVSAVAASWGKPPPAVFGRGINPMLELGQNLRRNGTSTALTYTTGLKQAPYLKVATLRDFTGKTWKPRSGGAIGVLEGEFAIQPDISAKKESTTISIKNLRTDMLPVPYPLYETSGLKGRWDRDAYGLTVGSNDDDTRGQTYSVTSLDVQPTATQMRTLTTEVGIQLQREVALPEKIPAVIERTARKVTANADNQYDKALALQDYLRNGDFTYSETAPVADGYDGNGVDVIAEFLDKKSGYCVHFSSAMAVMARTLDIPSRIAVGYAPGGVVSVKNGQNLYKATSDDLHAWTEIYFEGAGWIKFEPTPSVGSSTAFKEPGSDAPTSDAGEAPNSQQRPTSPDGANRVDSVTPASTPTSQTAPRTALITTAGLLLLLGAPWVLRRARRRWRLSRADASVEPLWCELEDTARDFGVSFSLSDTPRGFAGRLGDRSGLDHEALGRLLGRVERARFARSTEQDGDGVDDLRAVINSLEDGATRQERWRATVLPRSLAGRRAYVASGPARPATMGA